jgi:hypothetical protein
MSRDHPVGGRCVRCHVWLPGDQGQGHDHRCSRLPGLALGQLALVNTERMTPTAACLIRPAASDESAAVALDGWITGNAGCTAPAGMAHFETARFRSAYSGANSCRFSLHWGVVRCSQFPGAARFPLAGLAFHAGTFLAAAPPSRADGIRTRYRRRHASAPHGLSPAEQLRSAADIWLAIRKEATSCRTSREEQPGRIS